MRRDIVVTGLGAVTPLGLGAAELHRRWRAGECGLHAGDGAVPGFTAHEHLSAREARRTDRFAQFALVAAQEALAQAGWTAGDPASDPARAGCVIGTGIGGVATIESSHGGLLAGRGVPPLTVPLMMGNAAPAAVAMRHGIRGDVFGTLSACAAGAHAVAVAARMIRAGAADIVVAGGAEAALTPLCRAAFAALDALSATGVSRPFDARRDGFVMGEGAGILVLEDAGHATARGATVLARLRGIGATADAHHLTAPRPDGSGGAAAITAALRDAGASAQDVAYVNAHGTSTRLNDRAETAAIKLALGAHAARVPVSSTKSAIGHLLGAAGGVEAVATVLALRDRVAPPTIGWEVPEEGLDLDYVPAARPLGGDGRPALGLSNSFGFGGHNVVLCFEAA